MKIPPMPEGFINPYAPDAAERLEEAMNRRVTRDSASRPRLADSDMQWLADHIAHCRRLEYTREAQRFERIYAALRARPA